MIIDQQLFQHHRQPPDAVEWLRERCAVFAGATCAGLPHEMWCERCLAAEEIERLTVALNATEEDLVRAQIASADFDIPWSW